MVRATSSLPLPDSPVMSTVADGRRDLVDAPVDLLHRRRRPPEDAEAARGGRRRRARRGGERQSDAVRMRRVRSSMSSPRLDDHRMRHCGRCGGMTGSAAVPHRCRPLSYTSTDAARRPRSYIESARPPRASGAAPGCGRFRTVPRAATCGTRRTPPAPRHPPSGSARSSRSIAVDDRRGHDQAREPLVVGGHDVPRRVRRAVCADRVLVGRHVVVPVRALAHVAGRELPVLLGLVEPLQEALLLLLARDVEEELEDQVPLRAR